MAELKYAVPGASAVPCEVCEDPTFERIEVGDGFAAICSEFCLHAWPSTLAKLNTIARLERELAEAREAHREAEDCSTGGGDMRCGRCVACLSRVNHHLHEQNKGLITARDSALSGESEAIARAESAELGCEIAYRREPTTAEGDAFEFEHHQSMGPVEKSGETHVPMGNWHGHRCTCGKWVWGGGTVCQGCVDAQAVRAAIAHRHAPR